MTTRYRTLAAALRGLHLTQSELAAKAGISKAYVSLIMRGHRYPPLHVAVRIAEHARVPIESLVHPDMRELASRVAVRPAETVTR